ncbi:hypothetical protein D3C75_626310 [compost metagenome]
MGMDQIIIFAHAQLGPPYIILVGLNIFLHNRTFAIEGPVKGFKMNLFASLAPDALGQPE